MQLKASWPRFLILAAALVAACDSRPPVTRHQFHAFGTIVTLSFYGADASQSAAALAELRAVYDEVGLDWYPWADGELRSINEAFAVSECTSVQPPLAGLIELSALHEQLSGGRFNAGLGRLSEIWGLQPVPVDRASLPDAAVIGELIDSAPSASALRRDGASWCSDNPHIMIDPGGIAKGVVLTISAGVLGQHGIESGIINIGGDLLVVGTVNGREASIGIRSPGSDTPIAGLDVRPGEAVVTSGNYERFVEIDGRRYTHIFDPRTGYPVDHTVSVTVVDSDPALADAAATALLVGGPGEFEAVAASMGLTYALLIDAQGDARLTPAMAERLHWVDSSGIVEQQ